MSGYDRYLKEYIQFIRLEKGLSDQSVDSYRHDIRRYLKFVFDDIGLPDLGGITVQHIENYLKELTTMELSYATMARNVSSIKGFHNFAHLEGWTSANPADLIEAPKLPRKLPDVLTIEEVNKILEVPDTSTYKGLRESAILETLYACGLRVSELTGLTLNDLHTEIGFLNVTGKGSKERLVPMGNVATARIQEYLDKARPFFLKEKEKAKNAVFLNAYGGPLSRMSVWQIVKDAANLAGINRKVHPHIFRHSFATHLIEGGAGLREVQEMLGHVSILTTEIYTHIDRNLMEEVHRSFHPRA